MTTPKLSVPSSGYGTRGYRNPFTGEVVPGVTGVLGAIEKPGIVDFHISNTAAWAVANVDALLNRTEEQGMRFLQYYTRRLKPEKVDEIDVYNYSYGVLDDLSNLGNFMHTYAEDVLNDRFPEDGWRDDHFQMIAAFDEWYPKHTFRNIHTEITLFGSGVAGTTDWIAEFDGIPTMGDWKTSRRVYDSHESQLAALGSCDTWAKEVSEDTPGAVYYKIPPSVAKEHGGQVDSWWVPEEVPPFSRYGVVQIRPDDYDRNGVFIPAFVEFHEVSHDKIDAGFDLFEAALAAKKAQRKRKLLEKELRDLDNKG